MKNVYLDAEFDAVKHHGKYMQAVIALGAIITDENGVNLSSFYRLVKPRYFTGLSPVVRKITHLQNEQIIKADSFDMVMTAFMKWLRCYETDLSHFTLYSFGPDDKRTLCQNCNLHEINDTIFSRIQDVQKELSKQVVIHQTVIAQTLSLEDLKCIYDIQGEVEHNALNDALDLMQIHQAYRFGKQQNIIQVKAIQQRRIEKQEEVERRQKQRMAKAMRVRFQAYPKRCKLVFCHEVLDQLRSLKEQNAFHKFSFKKANLLYLQHPYAYSDIEVMLQLELTVTKPRAIIQFDLGYEKIQQVIVLSYRNATMIETFLLCSMNHVNEY